MGDGTPGDVSGKADLTAVASRDSAASSEAWLSVPRKQMADNPGVYTLRLRGDAGAPAVEVTVVTPSPQLQLDPIERQSLALVADRCCTTNPKTQFCATTCAGLQAASGQSLGVSERVGGSEAGSRLSCALGMALLACL